MRTVGEVLGHLGPRFQLAAALAWCEDQPGDTVFVTLDDRLRTAAGIAGFEVQPGTTAEVG